MTRSIRFIGALVCVVALASGASATQISLSLNLEFIDPSNFNSGGTWTVVAKADERGIAGIVLGLQDPTLNFNPATGFLTPAGFEIEQSATFSLRFEIVQADDLGDPTLDVGVIGGTFPSTYVDDANIMLFGSNPDLGSFTGGVELATGTFDPGAIPAWFDDGTDKSKGNLFIDAAGTVGGPFDAATTVRFVATPEPTTFALLGIGLAWLAVCSGKRA
jgi:hypothetical protein